eukprot:Gb_14986 [translate_table: standard]
MNALQVSIVLAFVAAIESVASRSNITYSGKIWFIEGNSSNNSIIPSCSDMCVSVLTKEEMQGWNEVRSSGKFPVGLYPCRGKVPDELWQYDFRTGSIKNIAYDFCLAAGNSFDIYLSSCTGIDTQISWLIEESNGVTRIRLNKSTGASPLYIQTKRPNKKNGISELYLGTARFSSDSIQTAFTVLNYFDPYGLTLVKSVGTQESQGSDMIVRNGGFEECGIDPGSGFIVLDANEPIPLCGWHVVDGQVEYGGRNLWPPYQGKRNLHLNSAKIATPGSVAQTLHVTKRANYSVVFYMGGNPDRSCGNNTKTLRVSITPSSFSPQVLFFNIAKATPGSMGWKRTHPLEFTASDEYVTITFESLTPGSCGPILSLLVHQRVKNLSWKELEKSTNNFSSEIGEGGFSKVYLARFPDETVGVVKVEKQKHRSGQTFKQELSVLLRARHVHLVNLIGFCNERDQAALVFEYMPNGNLHQRLHFDEHCNRRLPWQSRMTIAFQVAPAIEYLHEVCKPPIVHSDIKSANVLLDEKFNAKLCDFGFSKVGFSSASVFHSTVKGSLGYLDPLYCKSGILSKKSDIYSFGVLLLELITGRKSFCMEGGVMLTEFADPYLKDRRRIPELVDERLNDYFDGKEAEAMAGISALCIQEEANMRPCMTEILRVMRKVLSPLSITSSCQQMEEIMEIFEGEEEEELSLISEKPLNIHEIEEDLHPEE